MERKTADIFCPFRRKKVALTPEEYVRQTFLTRLVADFGYPQALISVEKAIGGRRYDAVVFSQSLTPLILLEFKRESVPLTQQVMDQAACYNRRLNVPYIIISNGLQTIVARVNDKGFDFLSHIPYWTEIQ